MLRFDMVKVEFVSKNSDVLDSVFMFGPDILANQEECIHVLTQKAQSVLGGWGVKSLTYQDDEGDDCTLQKATLSDALTFLVQADDDPAFGVLRVTVEKDENQPPAPVQTEPAEAVPEPENKPAEATSQPRINEAAVLGFLNSLGLGLDMRILVPKLAEAALRIVEREATQEPALYALLDVLVAFRDGHQTAEDLPSILPHVLEVLQHLPAAKLAELFQLAHCEVMGVVSELKKEQQQNQADVEVHAHVVCDGCNMCPIVGPRHKWLEHPDYDLCEQCFNREDRSGQQWKRVKSDVIAQVAASYYGKPCEAGEEGPIYHGITCDGCGMSPLVGQRFKANGMDYDLCAACMAAPPPEAADYNFEEVVVTTATTAVPLHAAPQEEDICLSPRSIATEVAFASSADVEEAEVELAQLMMEMKRAEENRQAAEKAMAEATATCEKVAEAYAKALQRLEVVTNAAVRNEEPLPVFEEAIDTVPDAVENVETDAGEKVEVVESDPKISAAVVHSAPLSLEAGMAEDESGRGDVSEEFAGALASTGTQQAFRIGRIVVEPGAGNAQVLAKVVVVNNGEACWPAATALSLAMGDGYGFPHMHLGALEVGEAAEIVMDLTLSRSLPAPAARSTWAIIDTETGAPLGPLLLFEVYAAC